MSLTVHSYFCLVFLLKILTHKFHIYLYILNLTLFELIACYYHSYDEITVLRKVTVQAKRNKYCFLRTLRFILFLFYLGLE